MQNSSAGGKINVRHRQESEMKVPVGLLVPACLPACLLAHHYASGRPRHNIVVKGVCAKCVNDSVTLSNMELEFYGSSLQPLQKTIHPFPKIARVRNFGPNRKRLYLFP